MVGIMSGVNCSWEIYRNRYLNTNWLTEEALEDFRSGLGKMRSIAGDEKVISR